MTGFLAQAAVRRTPVLLDGVVVTAAALVADRLAPGARQWWQAGHLSTEPAHTLALQHLALEPIVDLRMRLGEGTGAAIALPVAPPGGVMIELPFWLSDTVLPLPPMSWKGWRSRLNCPFCMHASTRSQHNSPG